MLIKRFRVSWLTILAVLILIYLRFFKLSSLFVFSADEEHQLSMSQRLVENFHWEWVGVSSADTGFYLGPLWTYWGAFWLWLGKGNLFWVAFSASIVGVITGITVYLVGKKIYSEKVAVIAVVLYSVLPLLAYYDRKYWNPALTPLISLMLFFSLFMTDVNQKWWLAVSLFYGLSFHVHLSLVPLLWIIGYWLWRQKRKPSLKIISLAVGLFLVVNIPLIGFDLIHNFSNLQTPVRLLQKEGAGWNFRYNLNSLSQSLGRLWYLFPKRTNADEILHDCAPFFNNKNKHILGTTSTYSKSKLFLSLWSGFLLLWFFLRRETYKNNQGRLLALFLFSYLFFFLLLPNSPLEYYLLGFFPLFLYLPALYVIENKDKWFGQLAFLFLAALSILGVKTIMAAKADYGLNNKIDLIKQVSENLMGAPFWLDSGGLCHRYEGWRMLFKIYGQLPVGSNTDQMFGWLYPSEIGREAFNKWIIMQESRIPVTFSLPHQQIFSSGGFDAYVFDKQPK